MTQTGRISFCASSDQLWELLPQGVCAGFLFLESFFPPRSLTGSLLTSFTFLLNFSIFVMILQKIARHPHSACPPVSSPCFISSTPFRTARCRGLNSLVASCRRMEGPRTHVELCLSDSPRVPGTQPRAWGGGPPKAVKFLTNQPSQENQTYLARLSVKIHVHDSGSQSVFPHCGCLRP